VTRSAAQILSLEGLSRSAGRTPLSRTPLSRTPLSRLCAASLWRLFQKDVSLSTHEGIASGERGVSRRRSTLSVSADVDRRRRGVIVLLRCFGSGA
jgi:hypothetical protein